jgi:XisI protein
MDRVTFLKEKINSVMTEYLKNLRQSQNQHIDFQPVIDEKGNHFQLIAIGWEGRHRVFNLLFHIDIVGEKIWIQADKMEDSVAELLVEKGVSKKDIVIGYFPDYHRVHTEYAVA